MKLFLAICLLACVTLAHCRPKDDKGGRGKDHGREQNGLAKGHGKKVKEGKLIMKSET